MGQACPAGVTDQPFSHHQGLAVQGLAVITYIRQGSEEFYGLRRQS